MVVRRLSLLVLLAWAVSCSSSTPTAPVSVTTAGLGAPANGATVSNSSQPVTLTVTNAVTTDASATVSYMFVVATDSLFTNKVFTQSVPQTAGGQTSLTLSTLPAGKEYYWRVQTVATTTGSGETTGEFEGPFAFTIGPALSPPAPGPSSPLSGTTTGGWPGFVVADAVRVGSPASVSYRFDISLNPSFSPILVSGTVSE